MAEASSRLERESRILILVGDVIEALGELPAPELDAERRAVEAAKGRFWEDPAREVSLEEPAQGARLPPGRLRRAFEASQGVDPETYRLLVRLALAKTSLGCGHTLEDAARQVGLETVQLLAEFERVYRVTPGAYRRAVAQL